MGELPYSRAVLVGDDAGGPFLTSCVGSEGCAACESECGRSCERWGHGQVVAPGDRKGSASWKLEAVAFSFAFVRRRVSTALRLFFVQALPCGGSGKSVPRRRRFTPEADDARYRGPLGARCIHMGLGVFLPLYGPCTVAIHVALGSAVCFTYHKDVPHLRGHAVSNYRDAAALIPRTRQKCCSNGPQINGVRCPGLIIIAAIYVLARRGHAVRAFIYEVVQLFI